jgi:hypothetical protein
VQREATERELGELEEEDTKARREVADREREKGPIQDKLDDATTAQQGEDRSYVKDVLSLPRHDCSACSS